MRRFVVGAVLGFLALLAVPVAGLMPHGVEGAQHTGWYRWLAVRQSVTLRSLTTVPPELDDPDRISRAAGHYELVCAACHGSPAAPPARIAVDLAPPPPPLSLGRWRPDARLFQTVMQGIRHSAMPAWPAPDRPDEVWDMVAFLRALPDLDAETYVALAGRAGDCAHCHGERGAGRSGMPRLDMLPPGYIARALEEYRAGQRPSGTMMAVARRMTDAQIAEAALAFGGQAAPRLVPPDDGSPGAALALRGDLARDIPACLSCHHRGDPTLYPPIIGQEAEYLARQLHLFVPEEPGHDAVRRHGNAAVMAEAARWLEPADIAALVNWLAAAR